MMNRNESRLGITHMPPETCPIINQVIRGISGAADSCRRASHDYLEDKAIRYIDEIENEVSGLEDQMEEIRRANEQLRTWGHEWKELALSLEGDADKLEEAQERISALEAQLAEANRELTLLRDYRKYAEREKEGFCQ